MSFLLFGFGAASCMLTFADAVDLPTPTISLLRGLRVPFHGPAVDTYPPSYQERVSDHG
jgi:hypothetical protein